MTVFPPVPARPLLAATISPAAAAWLLNRLTQQDFERGAAQQRSLGRPDVAYSIACAFPQLREASRQWMERENPARVEPVAVGGTAATAEAAVGEDSESSVLLPTRMVASALGVGMRRARGLLEAGAIDGQKVGGRWLADQESVRRYAADRRIAA